MLTTQQKVVLGERLLDDELVLDALRTLCRAEYVTCVSRLLDLILEPDPDLASVVRAATEASLWDDLVSILQRRVKEKPQAEGGAT